MFRPKFLQKEHAEGNRQCRFGESDPEVVVEQSELIGDVEHRHQQRCSWHRKEQKNPRERHLATTELEF